jgi:putative spermidine/putrescine transport system ATP-binding protein
MRGGRLEQIDEPSTLYARPATAFVAEFVGTMNRIPGQTVSGGVRTLDADVSGADTGDRSPGTRVDVLARPEALTLTAADHGHGIVTVRTFLGGVTRVGVRLDGDLSVLVDVPSADAAALTVGDAVEVAVAGHVLVVDPAE